MSGTRCGQGGGRAWDDSGAGGMHEVDPTLAGGGAHLAILAQVLQQRLHRHEGGTHGEQAN